MWLLMLAMGAQAAGFQALSIAAPPQQQPEPPPVVMVPMAPPAPIVVPPTYQPVSGPPLPIIGPDATPLPRPPLDLAIVKQPKLAGFYPRDLRKAGVEGSSRIDLTLDVAGGVRACEARSIDTVAALDEAACKFGLKLRFARTENPFPLPLPLKIEWRTRGPRLVRAARPKLPVQINHGSIIVPDDYPPAAMRAGAQGTTVILLAISIAGRVTNCQITGSSGSADLDSGTCRIFSRRGRFSAALDEFGVAVPGCVSRRIRWEMGEDAPAADIPAPSP